MLEELGVRNIALIEDLTIELSPGFTCLTGETGAGKSILAGALGLIRGNKGDNDLLRHGTDEGSVNAVFYLSGNTAAKRWLEEHDLSPEDDRVTIRRVLRRNGKAGLYIMGQALTLRELTEFAGLLFDMHGQHEHQNLFNPDIHRDLLDHFGGLEARLADFQAHFTSLAALKKKYENLKEALADRDRRREDLNFAIRELEDAKIRPGEDVELEEEKRIAVHGEKIFAAATRADEALSGDRMSGEGRGGLSLVFTARQALHDIALIDPAVKVLSERLDSLYYDLEDIAALGADYAARLNFDPGRIELIEDRLADLYRFKKKYGPSLEEVCAYLETAKIELDRLENGESDLGTLASQVRSEEASLLQEAQELSLRRKEAARRLKPAIESDLASLGMSKARFEIQIVPKNSDKGTPVCGLWGLDSVEFLLSANPGEPPRPIKSVASGGELSRIMLAIKNVLAQSDQVPCLVFDEVDTGIGGEVAVAVADHIQKLSSRKQIIAITHLASIAVRADNHIRVEKNQDNARTRTLAAKVSGKDRVGEIARMLSGDPSVEASLRHAEELLSRHSDRY